MRQWDSAAETFEFPDFDNGYFYHVDARLHCYRDAGRWALIVEAVGYSPRAGDLQDVLHVFGNCLTGAGPVEFLGRVDNWGDIEDPDDPEIYTGAPIRVRGQDLTVPAPPGADLEIALRQLVPEHRELLLADEGELRACLPAGLPEILRLDEWHQPALHPAMPSETETYRRLAEVLATGDLSRYEPAGEPNTHWSHWPDSGTL